MVFSSILTLLLATSFRLFAGDEPAAAALATESEAYCASTLNQERPTAPETVVAKVNEACVLL